MRIVREERWMLRGRQGQLGIKQHAGCDTAVQTQGCRWYQMTGTGIESRNRRIQIRQQRWMKRGTDGNIRPRALGPGRAWPAAALGPGRLAAFAPLARPIVPFAGVLPFPMMVRRMWRIGADHIQQLVLVIHEIGGGIGRTSLVRRRWSASCQTGTAARYCQ